jgi:hypothetical protein
MRLNEALETSFSFLSKSKCSILLLSLRRMEVVYTFFPVNLTPSTTACPPYAGFLSSLNQSPTNQIVYHSIVHEKEVEDYYLRFVIISLTDTSPCPCFK